MANGKAEKKFRRERDKFIPTFMHILTLSQWFGIPVNGHKATVLWAIVILVMLIVIECLASWKLIRVLAGLATHVDDGNGVTARLSGGLFYANGMLSLILSWFFAASWKKLSLYWARAEVTDSTFLHPSKSIQKRLIFVTCFITICASMEHMLSMVSATGFDCPPQEFMKTYILRSHGFLLHPENYSVWTAIPIFFIGKIATILWNFQDLIIILISMGLASRYHRLNLYVNDVVRSERRNKLFQKTGVEKYKYDCKWRRIREAYVRQAALVRMVDTKIGPLILLSNINNFYFICLQLFLGINKGQGALISSVYYFISLAWLIFRASAVVISAAEVNVHSKRALIYINRCSTAEYNVELKRLYNQLMNDQVALTGMGFFKLERETLLEVAGNIVKYELVLIEYDK